MGDMTETEYRETTKAIECGAWRTKPHAEVVDAVLRHRAEAARCERSQLRLDRVQAILSAVSRIAYLPSIMWVSAHPAAPWRAAGQSMVAGVLVIFCCVVLRRHAARVADRLAQVERWHVSIAMNLADVRDAMARHAEPSQTPADAVYRQTGVRVADEPAPAERRTNEPTPQAVELTGAGAVHNAPDGFSSRESKIKGQRTR